MSGSATLRPVVDSDVPFLQDLYASTREEELSVVPWSESQKRAFLRQQFEAQRRDWKKNYPDARFDIIVSEEGAPIGRLYVDRRPDEIRIVDIALVPESRGRGLGRALLLELLAEAARAGKPVTIHVEKQNPARRLYERLGFVAVADRGVYDLLRKDPVSLSVEDRLVE